MGPRITAPIADVNKSYLGTDTARIRPMEGKSTEPERADKGARARQLLALVSAVCVLVGVVLLFIYAFVVPS